MDIILNYTRQQNVFYSEISVPCARFHADSQNTIPNLFEFSRTQTLNYYIKY